MNLRQRTIVATGTTLIGLVVVVFACSHSFLLPRFLDLESRGAARNALQVMGALQQEAGQLRVTVTTLAEKDALKAALAHKDANSITKEIQSSTLDSDLVIVSGTDGQTLGFELRQSSDLKPELAKRAVSSSKDARSQPFNSLVDINGQIAFVSSTPVHSANSPVVIGSVTAFKLVDDAMIRRVAQQTNLQVGLADVRNEAKQSGVGSNGVTTVVSDTTVTARTFLFDQQHQPLRTLEVTDDRSIYQEGVRTIDFVIKVLIVAAVAFGAVIVWLVEFAALRRVLQLTRQVQQLTDQGVEETPLTVSGKDEVSQLAQCVNVMLMRIAQGKQMLEVKNQSLRHAVEELEMTNLALENAVEGIARIDSNGFLVGVNQAFAKVLGTKPERLNGKHWRNILCETTRDSFADSVSISTATGKSNSEIVCRKADGDPVYCDSVLVQTTIGEDERDCHYWFLKDISDRKSLEVRIQHQAFHDPLTGLPNRHLFMNRLEGALARARRHREAVGVVFIDLDNFKVINDSLGHEAGDNLLIAVAEVLRNCIRPEDTVARLGGDEFTILLSELGSINEVTTVVDRIIECFSKPILLSSGVAYASASFGITFSVHGEESPQEMLRDADTAMYQAKNEGRARYVVFDPSMNAAAVARLELESELRKAIEGEEFYLAYQPLIDLETGLVRGMEALLRWRHPRKGLMTPSEFMSVAEDTGLIVPIGSWALEAACKQTKKWNDLYGCRLSVSVNVSGVQVSRQDMAAQVEAVLKHTALEASLLSLEFSEAFLMKDSPDTHEKLNQLKALGVRLMVDNFGTGYSSMTGLGSLPIDGVKIDRSFVGEIGDNITSEAVVAAVVTLSKTMRYEVTAEGIELATQLAQLQQLGCNTAQGFLFFKPLLADEFEQELQNNLTSKNLHGESAA